MAFALKPVDEDFLTSAPQRYSYSMELPVPPEKVWAVLSGDKPLDWIRGLSITWTSPEPRGVGATRHANAGFGAIRLDEQYFIWEEGRRTAFFVTRVNVPLLRRFAEDYTVEPTSGGCRFDWVFAAEPRGPRPVAAANDLVQKTMFGRMAHDFESRFPR
ncbi:MAG: hypothetical protein QOH89_864 [Pseudonocardiales bacterium]|jgi:hypothetical protein|nr:hypothetical protein [Pseudonocardiales bacterium]MDT4942676.1 hypothetical protein [Pseudonocardiales bacterium]